LLFAGLEKGGVSSTDGKRRQGKKNKNPAKKRRTKGGSLLTSRTKKEADARLKSRKGERKTKSAQQNVVQKKMPRVPKARQPKVEKGEQEKVGTVQKKRGGRRPKSLNSEKGRRGCLARKEPKETRVEVPVHRNRPESSVQPAGTKTPKS